MNIPDFFVSAALFAIDCRLDRVAGPMAAFARRFGPRTLLSEAENSWKDCHVVGNLLNARALISPFANDVQNSFAALQIPICKDCDCHRGSPDG